MDTHEIELAVVNGDASWCSCTCGWASTKAPEDDVAVMWGHHVVERAYASSTNIT